MGMLRQTVESPYVSDQHSAKFFLSSFSLATWDSFLYIFLNNFLGNKVTFVFSHFCFESHLIKIFYVKDTFTCFRQLHHVFLNNYCHILLKYEQELEFFLRKYKIIEIIRNYRIKNISSDLCHVTTEPSSSFTKFLFIQNENITYYLVKQVFEWQWKKKVKDKKVKWGWSRGSDKIRLICWKWFGLIWAF